MVGFNTMQSPHYFRSINMLTEQIICFITKPLSLSKCKHARVRTRLSEPEDCIYSVLHPKSTALFTKQLLDLERCKPKFLVEICIYSVLHPKSTALFKKQLLDLECCKHKCLVEICFYSDADPNLHLDQKQNYFFLQLPKFDPNQAI